jgi:hypothetical protein
MLSASSGSKRSAEKMAQLKKVIRSQDGESESTNALLEVEKQATLAQLEALQASIMQSIDAREEPQPQPSMMSLGNKNKKKGFKKQMQGVQPVKTVFFPDGTESSSKGKTNGSAYFAPPSQRKVPANIIVSSVDVGAPAFVPGEAQPDFRVHESRRSNHGQAASKVVAEAGEWAGWMDLDQVARKFALMAKVTDPKVLSKGDKIGYQVGTHY